MKKVMPALIEWLMRFYSSAVEPSQRNVNDKIARKLHLWVAEKRYCRTDCTMADVADEFGVSVEALAYYFTNVVGERFGVVRKKLRLEEARRIICENPDCKIVVVGNKVGIPDKCNFRKQFHEAFGYSPSEWRKRCLELKRKEKH